MAQGNPQHLGTNNRLSGEASRTLALLGDKNRWMKEQVNHNVNTVRQQTLSVGTTAQQKKRWAKEAAEDNCRADKIQKRGALLRRLSP